MIQLKYEGTSLGFSWDQTHDESANVMQTQGEDAQTDVCMVMSDLEFLVLLQLLNGNSKEHKQISYILCEVKSMQLLFGNLMTILQNPTNCSSDFCYQNKNILPMMTHHLETKLEPSDDYEALRK